MGNLFDIDKVSNKRVDQEVCSIRLSTYMARPSFFLLHRLHVYSNGYLVSYMHIKRETFLLVFVQLANNNVASLNGNVTYLLEGNLWASLFISRDLKLSL